MEQVATMAAQDQSRALDARLTTGLHSVRSTLVPRLGRASVSTASTAEREEKIAEAWTILSYGLGVSVSLIPLTLICLRLEEMISCSWAIIAIPLWISKGLYLCCLWCCVIDDDTPSGIHIAWSTFMSALLVISQVNIVMKLDGTLDWSVVHALVPYFVYDGLNLVADCLFTGNPLDAIFRIVQTTLVAAKIDGHLQCSWWIVSIPSWIGIGSVFVRTMVSVVSMQISEEKLSFLAPLLLQVSLHVHQWYLYVFTLVTIALFIYKGVMLPYPPTGAFTWEVVFLLLYYIISSTRLFQASKGNRTQQVAPLILSLILSIPVILCHVYYIQLQTYVVRLDTFVNGLALFFVCYETLLSILALLLLTGRHIA
ncbi:hypothetical protein Poli38472_004241 [Pythium oligandrum]|uniref:Transmembrane protein n=1 Tax=Pythium oligandrum TaxID=41045 RepID=A0A8K1CPR4_PYTOL|nr:hypothetical protein Poli38472_004241 [Pythium oligandrum]|eukprot:TMW66476.1 hypothetical protein Poli38472_004241 [Pythium oligandrum]